EPDRGATPEPPLTRQLGEVPRPRVRRRGAGQERLEPGGVARRERDLLERPASLHQDPVRGKIAVATEAEEVVRVLGERVPPLASELPTRGHLGDAEIELCEARQLAV